MTIHRQLLVGAAQTNCYIVADERTRECAVIDPGDDAERILALLRDEGFDAKFIFLTHGHFDHVLAAPEVRSATGALIVIHALDAGHLRHSSLSLSKVGIGRGLNFSADKQASEGDSFTLGDTSFAWLHTPGHTPGSCCLLCGDALYSGDTLFEDDCGRCDLPGGNYQDMLASLRRLAALPGDKLVYPGHDVSTTLARERVYNANMLEALSE